MFYLFISYLCLQSVIQLCIFTVFQLVILVVVVPCNCGHTSFSLWCLFTDGFYRAVVEDLFVPVKVSLLAASV